MDRLGSQLFVVRTIGTHLMALDLGAIHEALAEQLKASPLAELFDVYPFPTVTQSGPRIEIAPAAAYVDYWTTFGPNGNADVMVTVRCFVVGGTDEDRARRAWQLVAAGTDANGNGQVLGVPDVVHADRTLGGIVQDAVILRADWLDDVDVIEFPVSIIVSKSSAEVA